MAGLNGANFVAGETGSKVYASGANTGLALRGFIPHADMSVTAATDKDDNNILVTQGWSGNTLIKGVFYSIKAGNYIKTLTTDQAFVGYYAEL